MEVLVVLTQCYSHKGLASTCMHVGTELLYTLHNYYGKFLSDSKNVNSTRPLFVERRGPDSIVLKTVPGQRD